MRFKNFLKKRHEHKKSKLTDNLKVYIETQIDLSEEEKDVITSIVKEGVEDNEEFHDTAIFIAIYMNCAVTVTLEEVEDGIKVSLIELTSNEMDSVSN